MLRVICLSLVDFPYKFSCHCIFLFSIQFICRKHFQLCVRFLCCCDTLASLSHSRSLRVILTFFGSGNDSTNMCVCSCLCSCWCVCLCSYQQLWKRRAKSIIQCIVHFITIEQQYIYIYTVRQASLSHRQSLWNANKMAFHFISFWFGSFVVGFLSLALLAGAHMLMWWKLLSASLFDSLFSFSILLSMCIYIYLYFAFRPRKEKIMRTMFTPLRIRIRMHCIERVWCIDVICVHKM